MSSSLCYSIHMTMRGWSGVVGIRVSMQDVISLIVVYICRSEMSWVRISVTLTMILQYCGLFSGHHH